MSGAPFSFNTPAQAVRAMRDAGAVFAVHHRDDGLGRSFTYRVEDGGDLQLCRRILVYVKAKPPQYLAGFKLEVERIAGADGGGR